MGEIFFVVVAVLFGMWCFIQPRCFCFANLVPSHLSSLLSYWRLFLQQRPFETFCSKQRLRYYYCTREGLRYAWLAFYYDRYSRMKLDAPESLLRFTCPYFSSFLFPPRISLYKPYAIIHVPLLCFHFSFLKPRSLPIIFFSQYVASGCVISITAYWTFAIWSGR